jgi:hypothetical protein
VIFETIESTLKIKIKISKKNPFWQKTKSINDGVILALLILLGFISLLEEQRPGFFSFYLNLFWLYLLFGLSLTVKLITILIKLTTEELEQKEEHQLRITSSKEPKKQSLKIIFLLICNLFFSAIVLFKIVKADYSYWLAGIIGLILLVPFSLFSYTLIFPEAKYDLVILQFIQSELSRKRILKVLFLLFVITVILIILLFTYLILIDPFLASSLLGNLKQVVLNFAQGG